MRPNTQTAKGGAPRFVYGYTFLVRNRRVCHPPDGHTTDLWESTPDSGGLYHVTDQYYPNGAVNTLVATNSSGGFFTGLPTFTYGVDGEGRATTVTAGSGQNPVTAASYYTTGGPGASIGQFAGLTYGSGDSDSYLYDPNTGRMTQYQFSINGSNVAGALTWNPNGTLQQLAITDPFNSSNTQTCQYQYDAIARLSGVGCTGSLAWSQTFTYDFAGNMKKSGSLSFQPNYTDANGNTNNRYYSGLNGLTYDNDGNLTNDTFHTYSWNGLGDLTSIDGNPQYHDALGRLVEWKDDSGTTYELMYAPAGAKIGMMTGQTLAVGRIPLPGGAIASYGSGGLNNYAHADWLGSTRFSSYAATRTMKWDLAHAPYGEVYALAGGGAEFTFTGQYSDYGSTNTLWDFPMREYHSSQGRWISPDPAGLAAVNPMNPQTWNRYAYVGANPLVYTDPLGLQCEDGSSGNPESGPVDCSGVNQNTGFYYVSTVGSWQDLAWEGLPLSVVSNWGVTCGLLGWCDLFTQPNSGGGGGTGTKSTAANNSINPAVTPTAQQTQNCLDNWNSSAMGKGVQFLSFYNFASNIRSLKTWAEWTALPYAKVQILGGINKLSQAIGNTEFWSITSTATSPAAQVVAPTAAGIETTESIGGEVTPMAIIAATVTDMHMQAHCDGFDVPLSMRVP